MTTRSVIPYKCFFQSGHSKLKEKSSQLSIVPIKGGYSIYGDREGTITVLLDKFVIFSKLVLRSKVLAAGLLM